MDTMIVTKWEEFTQIAASMTNAKSAFDPDFVFRGQSDEAFRLRPSLLRHFLDGQVSLERRLQTEKDALTLFQRQAGVHLHNVDRPESRDAVSWWILMQHYGVPTRLLDWTRSPFVALYFAVEGEFDKPGAVWAVRLNSFFDTMKSVHPNYDRNCYLVAPDVFKEIDVQAPRTLHFVDLGKHTDRMAVQQTAFSVSPFLLADHNKILEESLPPVDGKNFFTKVTIPAEQKRDFLRNLHSANITARTLFPGIDGFGRSVSELIKLDCQMSR